MRFLDCPLLAFCVLLSQSMDCSWSSVSILSCSHWRRSVLFVTTYSAMASYGVTPFTPHPSIEWQEKVPRPKKRLSKIFCNIIVWDTRFTPVIYVGTITCFSPLVIIVVSQWLVMQSAEVLLYQAGFTQDRVYLTFWLLTGLFVRQVLLDRKPLDSLEALNCCECLLLLPRPSPRACHLPCSRPTKPNELPWKERLEVRFAGGVSD